MVGNVLDLNELLGPATDNLAVSISRKYREWEMYRSTWMTQKLELRNMLFATDTTTTSNKRLPWKNSTTTPKLTQIRDNLHANYMTALFPNENWLEWEGDSLEDSTKQKAETITAYMKTKFRQDASRLVISQLLLDYIDYGNCFATVVWANDSIKLPDGTIQRGYIGPRFVRIAPEDIVFNPLARTFKDSPKIIRVLSTLGELYKAAEDMPAESIERKNMLAALEKTVSVRRTVQALAQGDNFKAEGFIMDGFSSIRMYYQSDYVEIMTFYGDIFDTDKNELLRNHIITIMDQRIVVDKRPNPNWTSHPGIFHASWRQRPNNLYGMGPLDNLVGMQYRLDHLENLKADVFDLIAYPVLKIKGYTDDFEYGPGERIYVGDDGDAEFMHPEATALQADSQMEMLAKRMEEMAGAPKEAMGFRTPGEKTKFEVQLLDNAASRVFVNKITWFETAFFEGLLNFGLQLARRNMSGTDIVKTLDSEIDAAIFATITKDDIVANGVLHPVGALNFADKANKLQTLTTLGNSHWGQDPAVNVHLSGKGIAKMLEDLGDLKNYHLFQENIRVLENAETQKLMATAQEGADIHAATPAGIKPGDPSSPSQTGPGGVPANSPAALPSGPFQQTPQAPDFASRTDQRMMDTMAATATLKK